MVKNTISPGPKNYGDDPNKFRPAMSERGPGPAAYSLKGTTGQKSHCITKKQSPAYSFGSRFKGPHAYTGTVVSPGPVYFITPSMTKNGKDGTPAYSFYDRLTTQKDACSPGPAAYHIGPIKPSREKTPPAYTFGSRTSVMTERASYPAPNNYTLPSLTGAPVPMAGKRTNPAYTMVGKQHIGGHHEDLSNTPGPGAYKAVPLDVFVKKSPVYTLHNRAPLPSEFTRVPAPGAYYPERVTSTKKSSPMYTFGIKHSEFTVPCRVDIH